MVSLTVVLDEIGGAFFVALIFLPIFCGMPFAFGWLLDRAVPSDEGPRIVPCLLISEIWTLLILGGVGLIAIWTHVFVFPPVLAFVLGGYFASRWRKKIVNRRSVPPDTTVRLFRWPIMLFLTTAVLMGGSGVVMLVKNSPPVNAAIPKTQWALNSQFAANSNFIVFPVLLLSHEVGFVWIERSAHSRKLIRVDGVDLDSPSISDDGQRLLFIKNDRSSSSGKVVRCTISTWQCNVLFALDGSLHSPIEIGAGNVLLAASALTERSNGQKRYEHFYFFYFDSETGTVGKLTDFVFPHLVALQYVKPRVYFTAFPPDSRGHDTGIFSQQFDESKKRFDGAPSSEPMNPLKGRVSDSSCSDQCRLMAFLNLTFSGYDLVISASGAVAETVKPNARGISRPSIVGDDVIINELFENEYAVTAYRLGGKREVLERLPSSPESFEKLDPISLSFGKKEEGVPRQEKAKRHLLLACARRKSATTPFSRKLGNTSDIGTNAKCRHHHAMSEFEGKAENICSY